MPDNDTLSPKEALYNAAEQDALDEQAPQTEPQVPSGSEEQPVEDKSTGLFHDINPESLTPDMRKMFDGMQSAYTQKTQEIAAQKQQYESLGDIDQARNAIQFVQGLQDPNNLVQLQEEISDYLQTVGFSKTEADQAATEEIQQADQSTDFDSGDDSLRKEVADLQNFKQQYEEEKLQADIETALARQESMIRHGNPSYDDEDIHTIYQLSYAYGGDLMSAQNAYESERQRILNHYTQAKAAIPEGVSTPSTGAQAQIPEKFDDFNAAHKYAKQRLAAIAGMGGLDD